MLPSSNPLDNKVVVCDSSDWWFVDIEELLAYTDRLFDEEENVEATFADINIKDSCRYIRAYLWEVQKYCYN